jgi:hypothetical protein
MVAAYASALRRSASSRLAVSVSTCSSMKVLVALRVPGVDVHEVVQVHRRYLVELMQQWTRIKEDEAEFDLGLALVVDAELFRLDSVIRWLDAADGRLKRAAVDPPGRPASSLPRLRRRVGVRR